MPRKENVLCLGKKHHSYLKQFMRKYLPIFRDVIFLQFG
jgi:hypothetical protein